MPFPRVSALSRALVMVVGLALSALVATAHARVSGEDAIDAPRPQATIGSHETPSGADLREGEHTRLVSSGAPSVLPATPSGNAAASFANASGGHASAEHRRWCDVVQCRRLDGVHLLGFATPPPSIG